MLALAFDYASSARVGTWHAWVGVSLRLCTSHLLGKSIDRKHDWHVRFVELIGNCVWRMSANFFILHVCFNSNLCFRAGVKDRVNCYHRWWGNFGIEHSAERVHYNWIINDFFAKMEGLKKFFLDRGKNNHFSTIIFEVCVKIFHSVPRNFPAIFLNDKSPYRILYFIQASWDTEKNFSFFFNVILSWIVSVNNSRKTKKILFTYSSCI